MRTIWDRAKLCYLSKDHSLPTTLDLLAVANVSVLGLDIATRSLGQLGPTEQVRHDLDSARQLKLHGVEVDLFRQTDA
jgi:hypothetical protein